MATNTAPQWLKNAGVFDHSTSYLLCVIASCILYTINLSVTRHRYIYTFHTLRNCAVRIALYHVTLINSGELSPSRSDYSR